MLLALLVVGSLLVPSRADAALCRDENAQPVACNQIPEGGVLISCASHAKCCTALDACRAKFDSAMAECADYLPGIPEAICKFLARHNLSTCTAGVLSTSDCP